MPAAVEEVTRIKPLLAKSNGFMEVLPVRVAMAAAERLSQLSEAPGQVLVPVAVEALAGATTRRFFWAGMV